MVQSLQLGTSAHDDQRGMQRLNRLPVIIAITVIVLFIGVVVIGLSFRGLHFYQGSDLDTANSTPATNFGDQLKKGVTDGIIGDPEQTQVFQPTPVIETKKDEEEKPEIRPVERKQTQDIRRSRLEPEAEWLARLKRENDEQYYREQQRQRMARLQARSVALDSPLKVDISDVERAKNTRKDDQSTTTETASANPSDLYAAALNSGLMDKATDANMQKSKEDFFNQDIKDLGYLPNKVVPQMSPFELKRGSVIPATMITGLNSDLPGRITAQVIVRSIC